MSECAHLVCTVGVNSVDQIPVGILHVLKADIAQNTSVVEQNINAAEGLDGGLDNGFAILDTVVVGDGLAASGADLLDDIICGLEDCQWLCISLEISNTPFRTCPHPCESHRGRSRRHLHPLKRRREHMPFPDHHRHR
jgi:hypothetical protein